jgi:hypothetical protein
MATYTVTVRFLAEAPEHYSRAVEKFVHSLAQSLIAETEQLEDSAESMEIIGAEAIRTQVAS